MQIQIKQVPNDHPNDDGSWVEANVPDHIIDPTNWDKLSEFCEEGFHAVSFSRVLTVSKPEDILETVTDVEVKAAPPQSAEVSSAMAKARGFTGSMCQRCFQFSMVQDGKCELCISCGATSGGCS